MIIKESQYKENYIEEDIEPLLEWVHKVKNPPKEYQKECLDIINKIHNSIKGTETKEGTLTDWHKRGTLETNKRYIKSYNKLTELINKNKSSISKTLDVSDIDFADLRPLSNKVNSVVNSYGFKSLPAPKNKLKKFFLYNSNQLYKQLGNDCILLAEFYTRYTTDEYGNVISQVIAVKFKAVGTDDSTLKSLNLLQESTIFDNIDFI